MASGIRSVRFLIAWGCFVLFCGPRDGIQSLEDARQVLAVVPDQLFINLILKVVFK